jgi:hypothetical protein
VPPLPNAWPRFEDWEESLLCLPAAVPNSGNRVDRVYVTISRCATGKFLRLVQLTAVVMAPDILLLGTVDMRACAENR